MDNKEHIQAETNYIFNYNFSDNDIPEKVEEVISKNQDFNIPARMDAEGNSVLFAYLDKEGNGLFHWLAQASAFDFELADSLFEKAPDLLDIQNEDGQLPIHIAAEQGNLEF